MIFAESLADWSIDDPTANSSYGAAATIAGQGTGLATTNFIIKVEKLNGDAINTKGATVGPHDNWLEDIDPPSATNVWSDEAISVNYKIYSGGDEEDSVNINITVDGGPA